MYILGVNPYHPDSSACIIKDGDLIAAVEEERFTRIKHWSGFPKESIKYCLREANVDLNEVDYIAINKNPFAHLIYKFFYFIKYKPDYKLIIRKLISEKKITSMKNEFLKLFHESKLKPKIYNIEHHKAHLASCFLVSNFKEAAIISIDGTGDFVTTMMGKGKENSIKVLKKNLYPHSLGNFYLAVTQYLGFKKYGDEYKIMGLSPYGKLSYLEKFDDIVKIKNNGKFKLNLDYFIYHKMNLTYNISDIKALFPDFYSNQLITLIGSDRKKESKLEKRHKDIARSLQCTYEKVFFNMLNYLYKKTGLKNLCIAGGCGMNSVANGKIFDQSPFKEVYIQAAAGDNGGSLGAAYYLYNTILNKKRVLYMNNAYLGPGYNNNVIYNSIKNINSQFKKQAYKIKKLKSENELYHITARYISQGKIIGWFQGRMEFGARALGNRSIICDPRRKDMKKILNARIKKRESFRPFAPTILREYVKDYFEIDYDVPFMSQVFKIKKEKRKLIPAVTHIDGTARLQTITKKQNKRYYSLIEAFRKLTGIPIVLNTSFNENEPIVNTPKEALNVFFRTQMDVVILGDFIIKKGV